MLPIIYRGSKIQKKKPFGFIAFPAARDALGQLGGGSRVCRGVQPAGVGVYSREA